MSFLRYVPKSEFERILDIECAPYERTEIFAALCRINTLYMITLAGSGHIGSSFSSLDIVSWLFLNELRRGPAPDEPFRDIYFSSKGHDAPGLYSVLAGLGALDFDQLHKLRRVGGLPGHPDIATPCIVTNTGSLGMGVSKAKGMALADRLAGKDSRIFVMTGDGELQEGQLWESLVSAANRKLDEITVIVDHNKLQSDVWVSKTNDLGDVGAKFSSFGWHVQRIDGHDFEALDRALAEVKATAGKPHVIIADTLKGGGVSFMTHNVPEHDDALYAYHSGAPDFETYERALAELKARAGDLLKRLGESGPAFEDVPMPERKAPVSPQRLIAAYSRGLAAQAEKRPDIVVLDADLKLDCGLIPFEKKFPDRFIECGIAEQDMVSQAGGLALRGFLPVVHSFACFLSTRPNEQIYNNATEKKKIIYAGSLAGVLPGGPGHSHQSVRDIGLLAGVPGLLLFEPCCEAEVEMALEFCVNRTDKSAYIRLVSIPCEISYSLPKEYRVQAGCGVSLTQGGDAVVFAYGPVLLEQACRAARILSQSHGMGVKVVNLPWLNEVDDNWLLEVTDGVDAVFTLDDHYLKGGQGEMIAAALARLEYAGNRRVYSLGLHEIPACGRNQEVLEYHGLDAESIAEFVRTGCGG